MARHAGSGRARGTNGWLAVPVAFALTGSVIAAFADAFRRHTVARSDHDDSLRSRDQPPVSAFDERAAGASGGLKRRLLQLASRRRWAWVGRVLQVQQRFSDLRGNDLASSVTLQAFFALFPLLLVAIAVLGYVNANSSDFTDTVIDNLGLQGTAAQNIRDALETASQSRRASTVVGLLGLAWSGLGVSAALRSAYNRAWQVQDRGLRDRAVGVMWLAGAALIFAASIAATAVVRFLPGVLAPLGVLVGLAVSFALFLWTERVLADVDVGWKSLVPGALLGAIGLEVLKALGTFVVPSMVASSSALYGTLGVVFAVLAWLLLLGRLVVYTAVLNVVLYEGNRGTVASTLQLPRHAGATREANRSGLSLPGAPSATA